jgi:hypothetical protein
MTPEELAAQARLRDLLDGADPWGPNDKELTSA